MKRTQPCEELFSKKKKIIFLHNLIILAAQGHVPPNVALNTNPGFIDFIHSGRVRSAASSSSLTASLILEMPRTCNEDAWYRWQCADYWLLIATYFLPMISTWTLGRSTSGRLFLCWHGGNNAQMMLERFITLVSDDVSSGTQHYARHQIPFKCE
jgi:hypothetical protein